jgi:hypothetical protein
MDFKHESSKWTNGFQIPVNISIPVLFNQNFEMPLNLSHTHFVSKSKIDWSIPADIPKVINCLSFW